VILKFDEHLRVAKNIPFDSSYSIWHTLSALAANTENKTPCVRAARQIAIILGRPETENPNSTHGQAETIL
jgi:hypothetical protein